MAITKLRHIKESPGRPNDHLRNTIRYILNPEKTREGSLAGGNAGNHYREILENFLETKEFFGKPDGRQGYHFVISFPKGSVDEETAYRVVQDFCEEYLGNDYDYVFTIHNDKPHLHGHIVFNSVSRTDGYKYHYKKGDWKQEIQPVTDRICMAYGLPPLEIGETQTGISYAEWAWNQGQKNNWTNIIRADIDFAIQQAESYEGFLETMEKMHYRIRTGYSRKHGTSYLTFVFVSEDGKEHKRRSYTLPDGYSPEEIMHRIKAKEGSRFHEQMGNRLMQKGKSYLKPMAATSGQTYRRLYQAVSYYTLPNPYAVPTYRVRRDMANIDRLLEECDYLCRSGIKSREEAKERAEILLEKQKYLETERKTLYGIQNHMDEEQHMLLQRHESLLEKLSQKELPYKIQENIRDELQEIREMLPHGMTEIPQKIKGYNMEISEIRKERELLGRIMETETITGIDISMDRKNSPSK